jgi:hypothetical protein
LAGRSWLGRSWLGTQLAGTQLAGRGWWDAVGGTQSCRPEEGGRGRMGWIGHGHWFIAHPSFLLCMGEENPGLAPNTMIRHYDGRISQGCNRRSMKIKVVLHALSRRGLINMNIKKCFLGKNGKWLGIRFYAGIFMASFSLKSIFSSELGIQFMDGFILSAMFCAKNIEENELDQLLCVKYTTLCNWICGPSWRGAYKINVNSCKHFFQQDNMFYGRGI